MMIPFTTTNTSSIPSSPGGGGSKRRRRGRGRRTGHVGRTRRRPSSSFFSFGPSSSSSSSSSLSSSSSTVGTATTATATATVAVAVAVIVVLLLSMLYVPVVVVQVHGFSSGKIKNRGVVVFPSHHYYARAWWWNLQQQQQTTPPPPPRSSSGSSRNRRCYYGHCPKTFMQSSSSSSSSLFSSFSSSSWEEDDEDDDDLDDEEEDLEQELGGSSSSSSPPLLDILMNLNRDFETGQYVLTNSFEEFLQQCTVQSLLYLMVSALHDRHTALWLEEFTSPVIYKKPKSFRNKDDQELETMASAYNQVMNSAGMRKSNDISSSDTASSSGTSDDANDAIVPLNLDTKEIKLLNYHGVGAMNTTRFPNPTWYSYFEKLLKEDTVTYEITTRRTNYDLVIDPLSLSRRLLSVRSQIANEFTQDLDMIAEMSIGQQKQLLEEESDGQQVQSLERFNVLSLQQVVDDNSMKPSPLRLGNYDLLLTLTTQEAIHRILNNRHNHNQNNEDGDLGDDAEVVRLDNNLVEYLEKFYNERLLSHFTGSSSRYNRATDFLDELLLSYADDTLVVSFEDETISNIRPPSSTASAMVTSIVAAILKSREVVANEWIDITLDVPDQHMEIQKLQLDRQMMPQSQPPQSDPSPTSSAATEASSTTSPGNMNSSWESYYGTSSNNGGGGSGGSGSCSSTTTSGDDLPSSSPNGDDYFQ